MTEALVPLLDRAVGDSLNAVDARELHRALEVATRFDDWFRRRVAEIGLFEGADFEKINDSASSNLRSANRVDYVIGLDAAKHIAMAERTDAGRRVRSYFIACEKRLRALPANPPALAQLGAALAEVVKRVDWLTQHVATGGVISPARHRDLKREVSALAELEVAVGRWSKKPAASRDIYREMGDVCGWGGKGTKWTELPATLEAPARSVLRRRRMDAMRLVARERRQLELVPKTSCP